MIVTHDDEVLSSAPCDIAWLMSCTHEESDTRMSVHATDGAEHGKNNILLRTVDTDVVVIGISMAQTLVVTVSGSHSVLPPANHTFRYIDATAMAQALGDAKCGLPAFRALTGCDVTSPFAGYGKRTARTAWGANDDTMSGPTLSRMPTTESVMNVLPIIRRSIVIMYDRGRSESNVNGERLVLFTQQVKEIENIPST